MLAAGALVASLLAVGASPAAATTDTADKTTKHSACVGDALGDQMFTDVSDMHVFKDAINCIAYYGITNGTGDGSTYSPNQDVTRAEMAVFIARAAGVAGVDLGDAMGDEFGDLDGVWPEARDAINQLASKSVISSGGAYRPGDAITRAEMASFLIGFLAKASPNVTIDSAGAIQLKGADGMTGTADDWFGDARAALPRANDAEVSALYELGITNGASPAAGAVDGQHPLDTNYEPHGTVDRGQMAAFITRALAHTSARPAGVSAQYDGTNVVVSVRDSDFQPTANVVVDLFRTDAGGAGLAFRTNGSCGEVGKMDPADNTGVLCAIDGSDPITNGDGETSVALTGGVDDGGTVVWAWAGDNEDAVDGDTDLFRLDIAEDEDSSEADRVRITTDFAAAKAHLGSSVLYTVQLQDANGDVNVGKDGEKPAQFLVTLSTYAIVVDPNDSTDLDRNPQGASSVVTLPLTTDSDGKATFSVSGLPDPDSSTKQDKYAVDISIQPRPSGNAPDVADSSNAATYYIGSSAAAGTPASPTGLVPVREAASDDDYSAALVFSTEASDRAEATVSVEAAADHLVASARGVSNRATVTVTDQYGDPIAGARVSLASADAGNITIAGGRELAVGRDGSYTFGYERSAAGQAEETLTASWDHDDDASTAAITGMETVVWAIEALVPANATAPARPSCLLTRRTT